MINEELINELVRHKQEMQNDFGWNTTLQTVLAAAIAALKAEPCEDAVSREAVLDAIKNNYRMAAIDLIEKLPPVIPKPTECENAVDRDAIIKEMETRHKNGDAITLGYIKNLPPVTPKLRTGKWTDDKCSVCGRGIEDLISSPEWYRNEEPKFCPYCGIKMERE